MFTRLLGGGAESSTDLLAMAHDRREPWRVFVQTQIAVLETLGPTEIPENGAPSPVAGTPTPVLGGWNRLEESD